MGAPERFGVPAYENEVERLCGYIKNDSVVRWYLGCSQYAVEQARAAIAKRQAYTSGYLPPSALTDEEAEERQRLKRAKAGNRAYLRAVRRAKC
jgi:hypothetical protein